MLDKVDEIQKAHAGLYVGEFGDASAVDGLDTRLRNDLEKAGLFSLPITMIILVPRSAPSSPRASRCCSALTAVFGTFGIVALPSHLLPMPRRHRRWCS